MSELENISFNHKKDISEPVIIDAKGSQCPGPIMTLKDHFKDALIGQKVIIEATDPGFNSDIVAWCNVTENTLSELISDNNGIIKATIIKNKELGSATIPKKKDELNLIIFSDEMDKCMASFNIALGAIGMGMKVNIFFTFWGLSLLRKDNSHNSIFNNPASSILPKDDSSLPLSHKNMFGLGRKMMERMMKEKNIPTIDFMVHLGKFEQIKYICCQMSMEILGLTKEDIIDGVEFAGVATMLENARKSNVNLFI